jgi:hypothetical protein
MVLKLAYFPNRCLAGPYRILCEYAAAEWEEKLFEVCQKEDGTWKGKILCVFSLLYFKIYFRKKNIKGLITVCVFSIAK